MQAYSRIVRISLLYKDNESVLGRINKLREVINTIKRRNLDYLCHIMRNKIKYQLLENLQRKVYSKRGPGRRRIS